MTKPNRLELEAWMQNAQAEILAHLEEGAKQKFQRLPWQSSMGEGLTAYVESDAGVLERAVVSFSSVSGLHLPPSATLREFTDDPFHAQGVSLVIHPANPYVPTVHFNVRMVEVGSRFWFGGGMDLTPYYPFVEDVVLFHRCCKDELDRLGGDLYPTFKEHCDRYFYLPHRGEARGVGGVFYDDVAQQGPAIHQAVVRAWCAAYPKILARRKDTPYGSRERDFQLWRRGRYVEFNLLYDRGTQFGLQSQGRVEAILLSLPPHVAWRHDWKPQAGSPEEKLFTDFLPPRAWV